MKSPKLVKRQVHYERLFKKVRVQMVQWTDARNRTAEFHVLPLGDLKEHVEKPDCWCQPLIEWRGKRPGRKAALVVHQSMDGRELIDRYGIN